MACDACLKLGFESNCRALGPRLSGIASALQVLYRAAVTLRAALQSCCISYGSALPIFLPNVYQVSLPDRLCGIRLQPWCMQGRGRNGCNA